jgi:regulator of PEP synthase PpsR (kinase-PPPase family)
MTDHDRTMFYVSDGTGITAEAIGHCLVTQFQGLSIRQVRAPFIDSPEKAEEVVQQVAQAASQDGARPIVISTLVDQALSDVLGQSEALVLDVFDQFGSRLEQEFGLRRSREMGQAHGLGDLQQYEHRMEATNYALKHDDGADLNYDMADVILVGVSRSGKTPTCLYLALHYGVMAGNYPLTEEDLGTHQLPARLRPYREKLFALTIDPQRLHQIRQERRPNSRYAELRQCQTEVTDAESMFRMHRLPKANTTHMSVEEIASKVLVSVDLLQRRLF